MNRNSLAGLAVVLVVVSSTLGWVGASRIQSPQEMAATTAAPAASPILVSVEEKVISTDVVARGTARYGDPLQMTLPPSALKPNQSSVTTLPLLNAELAEGDVLMTTSGRPVFVLTGARPTFRDMGPGSRGDDVRQLESALKRLGFKPGKVDGRYDAKTQAAVAAWYRASGFTPMKATDAQVAAIRALEAGASASQIDVLNAKDTKAVANAGYVAATENRVATTAAVVRARAVADADNGVAAEKVASLQGALDDLLMVPTAITAELLSAESALATAQAQQTSTRLAGTQSVFTAQSAFAPGTWGWNTARVTAQAAATAADLAAGNNVSDKQALLEQLRAGASGLPSTIRTARSALAVAVANATSIRTTGETAIATAQSSGLGSSGRSTKAAVNAATKIRNNALAALSVAQERARLASGDLEAANRRTGISVPSDEVVFVASAPVRVSEMTAKVGDAANGPLLTVTNSAVTIDSALPLEEAPLVTVGMTVAVDEPNLGLSTTGTVSRVATSPGTDLVDGFHVYFSVDVDEAPPGLVGSSVRLTIPIESSGGAVLTVPVSALSMTVDGKSRIQTSAAGVLTFVTVKPGLSAKGFVGVTPVGGALAAGDLVVVGFESAVVPSA